MSLRFSCISASWWSRRRGGALQRLDQPLSVANLARHAGWAPRTFARRFLAETGTTPPAVAHRSTAPRSSSPARADDLPIDQIAHRSGLGSAANLRLQINRDAQTTPAPTGASTRPPRPVGGDSAPRCRSRRNGGSPVETAAWRSGDAGLDRIGDVWSRRSSSWNYRELMSLGIGMVTIDCAEPRQLAAFWSEALDVPVQGDYGDFVFLARPGDGGPMLGLQRVPEPRVGKNRVHVDLSGGSRVTEVPRLVGLGPR